MSNQRSCKTISQTTLSGPLQIVLDHLQSGGESQVLNCGYGRGFSVRQVLDTIEQVSGKHLSIVETERRAGDPANLVADNHAIKKVLNWTPQYDDLAIICRTAYNWECR